VRSRSAGSSFIYLIILVAAAFLVYSFYSQRVDDVTKTPLTDVAAQVRQGNVKSIRVEGNNLLIEMGNGDELTSHKGTESTVTEQLRDLGVTAT
jgi:hypothetical protein